MNRKGEYGLRELVITIALLLFCLAAYMVTRNILVKVLL